MSIRTVAAIVGGFATLFAGPAWALTTLYTDQAQFLLAAAPEAFETFDDPTLLPGLTMVSDHDRWSREGMMYDAVRQGTGGTVWTFGRDVFAFGGFWDLRPGGIDRGLRLSVIYGDGSQEAVAWMTPQVASGFVGLVSNRAFTGLRVEHAGIYRGGQETYTLDNVAIRYAPITGAAVVIPEPSVWTLTILGFGAAGAMLRRRRAQPVWA